MASAEQERTRMTPISILHMEQGSIKVLIVAVANLFGILTHFLYSEPVSAFDVLSQ